METTAARQAMSQGAVGKKDTTRCPVARAATLRACLILVQMLSTSAVRREPFATNDLALSCNGSALAADPNTVLRYFHVRQDDVSHLPCAQPGGVPVPLAAHGRSDTTGRPLSAKPSARIQGVLLKRWQVTSDLVLADLARPDLAQALASVDSHMTTEVMTQYFESPTNVCDHCITELDAVFEAAVSGEYFFAVAADDDFCLWFGNTEADAMHAGPIVRKLVSPCLVHARSPAQRTETLVRR